MEDADMEKQGNVTKVTEEVWQMSAGSKAVILIALFVLEDSQQFLGNVLGKIQSTC